MSILKKTPYRLLLMLILAALLPLAFAPFKIWFLAPLILAIWQLILIKCSPRKSFGLSYLFGIVFFTVGLWWVRISINQFGGAPLPLAILIVILLASYLAIYYGVLGYFIRKIKLNKTLKYLLLFPTIGVLLELLRAHIFTGFPWFAMGYSMTETPLALFFFPVMGALMSSFIVYWIAGALVLIVLSVMQKQYKTSFISIIASLTSIIAITFIIHLFISDTIQDRDEPINIALIQGNISQDLKFEYDHFYNSIDTYLELTDRVIQTADIIVWPETAVPAYYNDMNDLMLNLRKWSDMNDARILLGIPRINERNEQFNSLLQLNDTIEQDQFYNKYRLLPFGEYIPLPELLEPMYDIINIPLAGFTPGDQKQPPFKFDKFATQTTGSICFEAVFGETLRYQAEQSGFLINVSNDAWFGNSLAPWQHLQTVQARAIEFARPIARSTNTGVTAFVSDKGEIIKQAPLFEAITLSATITGKKGLTPYVKFGDRPWIILFSIILCILLLMSRFMKPTLYP